MFTYHHPTPEKEIKELCGLGPETSVAEASNEAEVMTLPVLTVMCHLWEEGTPSG